MADISSEHPDLLPSSDGINQLGRPDRRWDRVYANAVSDGTREISLSDLATTDQVGSPVRSLPPPRLFDEGKILVVRNGEWNVEGYPRGTLPPVSADDEGKVLRVNQGEWELAAAMTLPPVDATMDGAILRVVAGQFVVQRGGELGEAATPCPVAPVQDGMALFSEGGKWVAKALATTVNAGLNVPPLEEGDIGRFLTLVPDAESAVGWKLAYTRPPVVTPAAPGAVPALPGDSGQFLNGAGGWSAITAGNNGHWRVGDLKCSLRPANEPGWLDLNGADVGKAGSGAVHAGAGFRALYAVLYARDHGGNAAGWEAAWDSGPAGRIALPFREYYKIRYALDAQAPAETCVLFDAVASHPVPTGFALQVCPDLGFAAGTMVYRSYPLSSLGWYRLGGDVPVLLSAAGDSFPGAEGVLFDFDRSVGSHLGAGLWYYRVRQMDLTDPQNAAPFSPWRYGSVLCTGAA
jgi:hypothetical protein